MDNLNDSRLPAVQILEKAASSDFYAERLADLVESRGLMEAPANLKSSVLARSKQPDVRLFSGSGRLNKRLTLWYYELKVSLAAACCVGLIISAPGVREKYPESPVHTEAFDIIRELNEKMDNFSRRLWEMEVEPYDKQEK